jgi:hypothetical protein
MGGAREDRRAGKPAQPGIANGRPSGVTPFPAILMTQSTLSFSTISMGHAKGEQ